MNQKIIHMIYFPWGKDQKLLLNCHDFDHRPYEKMVRYAPTFRVRLWTFDQSARFADAHYPGVWPLMMSLARPTMMVDIMRWLVVYHYGGIYWQYEMDALAGMDQALPGPGKSVKLFTEFVNDSDYCRRMANEPIRKGIPEEPVRVCNQCFAAVKNHPFVKQVLDTILNRSATLVPRRDYDILYICANAAVSTVYDQVGVVDRHVELVSKADTRQMMRITYRGSWRQDRAGSCEENPVKSGRGKGIGSRLKGIARSLPLLYHVRMHAHERILSQLRRCNSDLARIAPATLEELAGKLEELGSRRVLSYPSSHTDTLGRYLSVNSDLWEWDPTRESPNGQYRNILFARSTGFDTVVIRNFLDYFGFERIAAMLHRMKAMGVRLLVATGYPCLNANWDTYDGEGRPVHLGLSPFELKEVHSPVKDPGSSGRTDRSLCWFSLDDFISMPHLNGVRHDR